MAALVTARIYLPPPARWGELSPAAGAAARALEGATLGGHRVLRAEWSSERCRLSPTSDHLVAEVTLTVDGEPAPAALCGLYAVGRNVVHVISVEPLPAATEVALERLDAASTASLAARLGLGARDAHVVLLRKRQLVG